MAIQNQNTTIILQKINPIKYHICLAYDDYILQTWSRTDNVIYVLNMTLQDIGAITGGYTLINMYLLQFD